MPMSPALSSSALTCSLLLMEHAPLQDVMQCAPGRSAPTSCSAASWELAVNGCGSGSDRDENGSEQKLLKMSNYFTAAGWWPGPSGLGGMPKPHTDLCIVVPLVAVPELAVNCGFPSSSTDLVNSKNSFHFCLCIHCWTWFSVACWVFLFCVFIFCGMSGSTVRYSSQSYLKQPNPI